MPINVKSFIISTWAVPRQVFFENLDVGIEGSLGVVHREWFTMNGKSLNREVTDEWAKKIKPENEIWFKDKEDARRHGYVPCKVCKP